MLGGVLLVVAASMLTYLIPTYNMGGSAGGDVVAEIGKEALSTQDVRRTLQQQLKNRQIPPEMVPSVVPQIIDGIITEWALAYEARRLGFTATPEEVANTIRTSIPSLFPGGQFVGKEAYAAMLAQQNLTIPEFEEELARSMLGMRLRDIALEGIVITPAEVEQEYRHRNEKTKIEYVKLSPDQFRSQIQVAPEELRAYFKANAVPERATQSISASRMARPT